MSHKQSYNNRRSALNLIWQKMCPSDWKQKKQGYSPPTYTLMTLGRKKENKKNFTAD